MGFFDISRFCSGVFMDLGDQEQHSRRLLYLRGIKTIFTAPITSHNIKIHY